MIFFTGHSAAVPDVHQHRHHCFSAATTGLRRHGHGHGPNAELCTAALAARVEPAGLHPDHSPLPTRNLPMDFEKIRKKPWAYAWAQPAEHHGGRCLVDETATESGGASATDEEHNQAARIVESDLIIKSQLLIQILIVRLSSLMYTLSIQ